MRLLILWALAAPCFGQFVSMEFRFEGIGCASCMESLPERVKRLRGVESAAVDAEHGTLKLRLAAANRVRIEQVRDMIEQDGTKTRSAEVEVRGQVLREDGKWILQPAGVSARYEILGGIESAAGTYVVIGTMDRLRPEAGNLIIKPREIHQAER
jgi:cation transport ATPase